MADWKAAFDEAAKAYAENAASQAAATKTMLGARRSRRAAAARRAPSAPVNECELDAAPSFFEAGPDHVHDAGDALRVVGEVPPTSTQQKKALHRAEIVLTQFRECLPGRIAFGATFGDDDFLIALHDACLETPPVRGCTKSPWAGVDDIALAIVLHTLRATQSFFIYDRTISELFQQAIDQTLQECAPRALDGYEFYRAMGGAASQRARIDD